MGDMNIRIYATVEAAGSRTDAAPESEHAAYRPSTIQRQGSEATFGRQGAGAHLPAASVGPHGKLPFAMSIVVPPSEFKLQWPQTPLVPASTPRLSARTRPQSASTSRMSQLCQPPNRTPRSWQKLQQRDELESRTDADTPRSSHRPGWLSARRPEPGHSTPRLLSARARRPPQWRAGEGTGDPAGATMMNLLRRPSTGNVRTESVEMVQQQQEMQARQEMRQLRDELFDNPKRRFTKGEMERFCQKLLGNSDIQLMQKICSKAPEDRSHEDCNFLCQMLGKHSFLRQNLSRSRLLSVSRCFQTLSLSPGEDMHVQENAPQIFILVQGLIAEPISGDLIKQGDHILRMPRRGSEAGSRWNPLKTTISTVGRLSRRKILRRPSEGVLSGLAGRKNVGSSAPSPTLASEKSSPPMTPRSPAQELPSSKPVPDLNSENQPAPTSPEHPPEEDGRASGSDIETSNFSRCSSGASSMSTSSQDRLSFMSSSLAAPLPSTYKALDQCHLLVFNLKHLSSLADSFEVGTSLRSFSSFAPLARIKLFHRYGWGQGCYH